MIEHWRECPTCEGVGKVHSKRIIRYSEGTRKKARELYRQGVSLRKIAKEIGIKPPHPQKVMSLINAKTL